MNQSGKIDRILHPLKDGKAPITRSELERDEWIRTIEQELKRMDRENAPAEKQAPMLQHQGPKTN